MIKLNHLALAVSDYRAARDWYAETLGLTPEFELPERRVAAVQDDADFTLILFQTDAKIDTSWCNFAYEVDDVEERTAALPRAAYRSFIRRNATTGATAPSCSTGTATACGCGTR